MNEVTYSLCQKPLVGAILYITSLCGFPNVFENLEVDLSKNESTKNISFEIPVSKNYLLELALNYSSNLDESKVNLFLGDRGPTTCLEKSDSKEQLIRGENTSTPMEIFISSEPPLNKKEHFYVSGACGASWFSEGKSGRSLAWVYLQKGKYTFIAKPVSSVIVPHNTHSTIQLSPGLRK